MKDIGFHVHPSKLPVTIDNLKKCLRGFISMLLTFMPSPSDSTNVMSGNFLESIIKRYRLSY